MRPASFESVGGSRTRQLWWEHSGIIRTIIGRSTRGQGDEIWAVQCDMDGSDCFRNEVDWNVEVISMLWQMRFVQETTNCGLLLWKLEKNLHEEALQSTISMPHKCKISNKICNVSFSFFPVWSVHMNFRIQEVYLISSIAKIRQRTLTMIRMNESPAFWGSHCLEENSDSYDQR